MANTFPGVGERDLCVLCIVIYRFSAQVSYTSGLKSCFKSKRIFQCWEHRYHWVTTYWSYLRGCGSQLLDTIHQVLFLLGHRFLFLFQQVLKQWYLFQKTLWGRIVVSSLILVIPGTHFMYTSVNVGHEKANRVFILRLKTYTLQFVWNSLKWKQKCQLKKKKKTQQNYTVFIF